jgi:serine/threonine protein kinase
MPSKAPEGLCPKCLLLVVAAPTESGTVQARPAPPTLVAVAAAFPQLEILQFIGQGGMGCVFKARQRQLNRLVALKVLPEALARDPAFAARFVREAQALAALNHPNIVTIHDFGQSGGFFYLLMELVDGVNLRQALRGGRFTPEQALAIVPPICEALQFAHERGIVHRDIKPENLLLDQAGRVKIADFGIAKMVGAAPLAADERSAGTPHYVAPEQKDQPRQCDHRADIYSLGVVLYEMLTGELPRDKLQPPSHKVQIDVRLDEVVLRAMEKSPELRWQTAAEFRTQVETIATSREVKSTTSPLAGPVGGDAFSSAPQPEPPRSAVRAGRYTSAGIVGLAVFTLIMIGVTIFTFCAPKSYTSANNILIRDRARVMDAEAEIARMQSSELLQKVATDLDLKSRWAEKLGSGTAFEGDAVGLLRHQMACRHFTNSSLMQIRFTSDSREEAAEIANGIAAAYCSLVGPARAVILQGAEPRAHQVKPNIPVNIAVGALAAIVLGLGAAQVMTIAAGRRRDSGHAESGAAGSADLRNALL